MLLKGNNHQMFMNDTYLVWEIIHEKRHVKNLSMGSHIAHPHLLSTHLELRLRSLMIWFKKTKKKKLAKKHTSGSLFDTANYAIQ